MDDPILENISEVVDMSNSFVVVFRLLELVRE